MVSQKLPAAIRSRLVLAQIPWTMLRWQFLVDEAIDDLLPHFPKLSPTELLGLRMLLLGCQHMHLRYQDQFR